MKFINVSESVWICQDSQYYLVNSVCVNLGSELLFVDTGINSLVAQKFRKKMHKVFNQEKAILTLTHANNDHFIGLEAFMDLPVIVSDKFMLPFHNRVKSMEIKKFKSFVPTKTYSSSIIFGSEGGSLTFTLTGGHTDDSCYGYYPAEKILIAGDNIITDMSQFFLHPDSNLQKYIKCLKSWKKLDIETIIPGHGNITNPAHISKVLTYFERLNDFLIQAKKSDLQIHEILKHKDLPKYFEPDPNNWIRKGIEQIYRNLNVS